MFFICHDTPPTIPNKLLSCDAEQADGGRENPGFLPVFPGKNEGVRLGYCHSRNPG